MITKAIQRQGQDLVLTLHIQPNAACTEFVGLHGEAIKIRLHAPPVDGKANEELCRFLAQSFAVKRHAITLLSGETSRTKRVRITHIVFLPPLITRILQGDLE